MPDYVILTDSTTDFSGAMIKSLDINVIPLRFNMGGISYFDDVDKKDLKIREFYNKLRQGELSRTSQINPEDFINVFRSYLEAQKDILYIAFSSGLSNTYSSACIAANELKSNFPDRKIIIIDSLCASLGEGLLVYLAVKEKQKGTDIESLSKWIEGKKKSICHLFTVDDLNYLKRGGRISTASAFLGSLLHIKPLLHVDDNGKLVLIGKERGRKKAISTILDKMEKCGTSLESQEIFISHGDCENDANYAAHLIKERFKVKNIFISTIGHVIGSHSGPGTLAIFFVGSER